MDLLEAALALSINDRSFLAEKLVESLPADPRWFAELECRVRRAITDPDDEAHRSANWVITDPMTDEARIEEHDVIASGSLKKYAARSPCSRRALAIIGADGRGSPAF
jgi:hypothetical protein